MSNTLTLTDRDKKFIWHPYTQHLGGPDPLSIVRGKDALLFDKDGKQYIDAISSWWTNIHGHSHPHIAAKIYEQALQLEHVIFAGCTHEPAVLLAERLLPLLPKGLSKFFYSDNGSTAVEVALKMAIQQRMNNGTSTGRDTIVALKNSYHGDTFGAMSVSDRGVFTIAFEQYLFDVVFIDMEKDVAEQYELLDTSNVAAFIYEPLVQGAGGMKMYDASSLDELLSKFKKGNVVCIADEVMTGFGRTGKFFASEYLINTPDIICLSKGLTGGSLPLSLTVCTQNIYDAFLSNDLGKTFFHGHSYTANPIACAAALASLDLLMDAGCMESIQRINQHHRNFLEQIKQLPAVLNPRCLGTILAFELNNDKNEYLSTIKQFVIETSLKRGILLRPLGNTVYVMPPYCITDEQLGAVYDTCLGLKFKV